MIRRRSAPRTVQGMAHEIPVVDIGPFLAGGDGAAAAAEIETAATQVGFFQIIGHGVPTRCSTTCMRRRMRSPRCPWQ